MRQHEIIRERLEEMNCSSYWLAKQTGRSPQYMSRVVRGHAILTSTDLINKVAKVLNLNPDDLYVSAGRLPPDIVQTIITYPAMITAIRTQRARMEATK